MAKSNLLFKITLDASELVKDYPSDWYHEHKHKLFELTSLDKNLPSGTVLVSRYQALRIPSDLPATDMKIVCIDKMFDYTNIERESKSWYLNFADGDLFNNYGSALLAQDELQVAEHPILANVLEYLRQQSKQDSRYDPNTRDYDVKPNPPTPVLIEGAERRIYLNTLPSVDNEIGLYGNNFAKAAWEEIAKEVRVLNPPVATNIIAMEAYPGGEGCYTKEQINDIFITAYTAFSAARIQTEGFIEIHTGDWGTGAYGGNKILTACLQLLAANAADIDLLAFHTFDQHSFEEARELYESFIQSESIDIPGILQKLEQMKFQWGTSDGN